MRKMRIRGQIIDFIEVEEEEVESLFDKLIKVRNDPKTDNDVRLIIQFLLGEE